MGCHRQIGLWLSHAFLWLMMAKIGWLQGSFPPLICYKEDVADKLAYSCPRPLRQKCSCLQFTRPKDQLKSKFPVAWTKRLVKCPWLPVNLGLNHYSSCHTVLLLRIHTFRTKSTKRGKKSTKTHPIVHNEAFQTEAEEFEPH